MNELTKTNAIWGDYVYPNQVIVQFFYLWKVLKIKKLAEGQESSVQVQNPLAATPTNSMYKLENEELKTDIEKVNE